MKSRCLNSRNPGFRWYGARGIQICERWMDFQNFLEDMGERPANTSLERRDNNGNYEPTNCYWATHKQQMNNTRMNVFVEHGGRRQTVTQWANELGMPITTLEMRLKRGWSTENALFTPRQTRKLTPELAERIRHDPRLQREIAADYGISKSRVSMIKSGSAW